MSVEPKDKMLELVEALGYTYLDEEMHVFVGDYFVNLSVGAHMIETEVMKLKMLSMSDEERKKQELIMKNREEYLAKQKADRELKKKLEEYSQKDRKVKQEEKASTAKANQLKYGANIVKFEPPKESKGG